MKNITINLTEKVLIPKFGDKYNLSFKDKLFYLFDLNNHLLYLQLSWSNEEEEYAFTDVDVETSKEILAYLTQKNQSAENVLRKNRKTLTLFLKNLFHKIETIRRLRLILIFVIMFFGNIYSSYFSLENNYRTVIFCVQILIITFQFCLSSYFILEQTAKFLAYYRFKMIIILAEYLNAKYMTNDQFDL